MKKIFALFFVVSLLGLGVGAAYGWMDGNNGNHFVKETAIINSSSTQETIQPQNDMPPQPSQSNISKAEEGTVTNPNKICSTPGCDNAVFVTYRERELCVKCYGEAKKSNSANK